ITDTKVLMKPLKLIACAIALTVTATPASAATIVRNGDRIVLTGSIVFGDDVAFAAAVGEGGVRTVVLGSDGGYVNEAMAIGRLIRGRGLDTSVPSACMSACVLIWAGGKTRTVAGALQVHCPTLLAAPYQCDAPGRERMVRYLREMNAPAGI